MEPVPLSIASTVTNGCPLVPTHCRVPRLAVTPRVSGLERSQERSLDLPYPETLSTSTSSSLSCLPLSHSTPITTATSLAEQINGNGPHLHHRLPERGSSSPRPKHKPFLTFPGRPTSNTYSMGVNSRCVMVAIAFVGEEGYIEVHSVVMGLIRVINVIIG